MEKPKAKVIGEDSNVFTTLAICIVALKKAKMYDEVKEMRDKVLSARSYDDALCIMSAYCELV